MNTQAKREYPERILDAVALAIDAVIEEWDLIAVLDALVDATGGPDHIAKIDGRRFNLQHPITERFDGSVLDCRIHQMLTDIRPWGPGTFRVWVERDTILWEAVDHGTD